MANTWYRIFHHFCNRVYFERVSVLNAGRLPRAGPVLYLGLHRNGAVDGFLYHDIVPDSTFMISTQLRRSLIGRLFFAGIEVVRTKDAGDPGVNEAALKRCIDLLRGGGELFVFPEGTSSLGPRHLPFKSGAAQLLNQYLIGEGPIAVVPLGIHYECAWGFRSKVEIVVGEPLRVELDASLSPLGRLKELKRRMRAALEAVGINVESDDYQEAIQRLAYVATLGTPRSYFRTLKSLETVIPATIVEAWNVITADSTSPNLLKHQGVPLFPSGPVWSYAFVLLLLGPLVAAAIVVNLPPFLAGWWAGRTFPDDRNVISLWRILVGIPVFALWILTLVSIAVTTGTLIWFCAYAVITFAGLKLYYRVKKLGVAVANGIRQPALRPRMLAFHELVLTELPREE